MGRTPEAIPEEAVRAQLQRILSSRTFARSPRISRFISFVVEQTLEGQEDKLKEYLLGVEVFNRNESFDPRIDSIVRVEARRLRYKLERYYESEGLTDEVYIKFRKGCYVPLFMSKSLGDSERGDVFEFPHLCLIENPQAFTLYAKGRHHLGRWTADGIAESISCFTQALGEDPECAGARAGLGAAFTLASLLGVLPAHDAMPKAKSHSRESTISQQSCPEGFAVQGIATALYDFEWKEAESHLRKAIQVNQGGTEARVWYGFWAMLVGQFDDAIRELRKAQQSDPTCMTAHMAMGFACQLSRASDEALMQYRLAHDIAPTSYAPHLAMGLLFAEQRMHEQSSHALSQASQLSPKNPTILAALAYSHGAAGRTDSARQVIAEMEAIAARQYVPAIALCLAYSGVGDVDAAVQKLEAAYEERSSWLALVRLMPAFQAIRNDDRYPALLARIGLT